MFLKSSHACNCHSLQGPFWPLGGSRNCRLDVDACAKSVISACVFSLFGYQQYSKGRKLEVGRDRNRCTDLKGQRNMKLATIWCLLLALGALWRNMFWVVYLRELHPAFIFASLLEWSWRHEVAWLSAVLQSSLPRSFPPLPPLKGQNKVNS